MWSAVRTHPLKNVRGKMYEAIIETEQYVYEAERHIERFSSLRARYPDLDDVLFLSEFKQANSTYPLWVEFEVKQNIASRIGEGEVPRLVKPVLQQWDEDRSAFISYGASTIRHSLVGLNMLDFTDPKQQDEFRRRQAFIIDEQRNHDPLVLDKMATGAQRITVSCRVEAGEVPDLAFVQKKFGYDERTMVFAQTVSEDKQTKILTPIQVFGVPNIYIAHMLEKQFGFAASSHGATLLEQMSERDCMVERKNPYEVVDWFFENLLHEIDDPVLAASVRQQYDEIVEQQMSLQQIVAEKTDELFDFCIAVESSLAMGHATNEIMQFVEAIYLECSSAVQLKIDAHRRGSEFVIDYEFAELLMQLKKNPLMLRAGVLAGNKDTIQRVGEAVSTHIIDLEMQHRMHTDQHQAVENYAVDKIAASSNAKSGGGCSGELSGLFGGTNKANESVQHGAESRESSKTEVMRCVTCPLCGKEGVDATIKYTSKQKTITCSKCKGSKTYKNE
jgi:hypothetical protein